MTESVQVTGQLVIDAGALVCFARDVKIEVQPGGTLTAGGTAEARAVFTAANALARWGGISVSENGKAALTYTRLEHATTGVDVRSAGDVVIERSVLRRIEGSAVALQWAASASIVETMVDSTCSSECGAAIRASGYLKFQDSRILASGAVGLYGDPYSEIELDGGSIEDSKDIGLVKSNYPSGSRTLGRRITAVRPIRITGGASYPAQLPLHFAAAMVPSREAQDGWRGNAKDTVLAVSEWYGLASKLTIYPGLAWKTTQVSPYVTIRLLELEPGAALVISGYAAVERVVSRATAEAPAEVTRSGTSCWTTSLWKTVT